VDESAVHLSVEIEVEAVQGAVWIPEAGQLVASGEEAVLAA
jgi:hypothetical protein